MILYLPIERKWHDMIHAGIKKEEYRKFNSYWIKRIARKHIDIVCFIVEYRYKFFYKCDGIEIKVGKIEWGAPPFQCVYAIKISDFIGNDYRIPDNQLSLNLF